MQSISQVIQNGFLEAKARNSSYSKRSYAKKIGLSPGALVDIMNGKRRISPKLAQKLSERLGLAPESLLASSAHTPVSRQVMAIEQFESMANLQHFYLLKLLELKPAPNTILKISARLGIGEEPTKALLDRLLRLGMIKKNPKGGWRRVAAPIDTPDHISSPAIRSAHRDALNRAERALELPIDEREFSLSIEIGSAKQIPVLKKMIREFQDKIHHTLAAEPGNQIFQLNIQFFSPLK